MAKELTSAVYELVTLACPLLSVASTSERLRDYYFAPDATGELLGSWRTEIGALGRLLVLRRFENADLMEQERRRTLLSANPLNAATIATSFSIDSYSPFSFLPRLNPGARGKVYEFRSYWLKPGGLPATLAGWEHAIEPAREYTAHLLINMYALDGPPRITHIWGFSSLEERASLRSSAYAAGIWPPKGGPENILDATSTIALPELWSPLF